MGFYFLNYDFIAFADIRHNIKTCLLQVGASQRITQFLLVVCGSQKRLIIIWINMVNFSNKKNIYQLPFHGVPNTFRFYDRLACITLKLLATLWLATSHSTTMVLSQCTKDIGEEYRDE